MKFYPEIDRLLENYHRLPEEFSVEQAIEVLEDVMGTLKAPSKKRLPRILRIDPRTSRTGQVELNFGVKKRGTWSFEMLMDQESITEAPQVVV